MDEDGTAARRWIGAANTGMEQTSSLGCSVVLRLFSRSSWVVGWVYGQEIVGHGQK